MNRKPPPKNTAQVCWNGHLVLSSIERFPQFRQAFCEDCGSPTIERCPKCDWPIEGLGEDSWTSGPGPYRPPKYCGECGNPFPWTESALLAAKEYADELEALTAEEKAVLKGTFPDLTADTARTPLAVSRFKKLMDKVGPTAAKGLSQIVVSVATEVAKRSMGL